MTVQHLVYEGAVIAIAMVLPFDDESPSRLAIRWLAPGSYRGEDGREMPLTNAMGGETDWFVMPSTLGAAIGRTLVQQKATGMDGFHDDGLAALVRWLVEAGELSDSMSY